MQEAFINWINYESYYFDTGSFEVDEYGLKFEDQYFNGFCIDQIFWDSHKDNKGIERIVMGSTIMFVNYE